MRGSSEPEGRIKVAFLGDPANNARVFAQGRREAIEARAEVLPGVLTLENLGRNPAELAQVEAVFSTWGIPLLSDLQLDAMPNLRAVFYAAGAIGYFAPPLLKRGIIVCSAWKANAVPVAQFTVSQILLSCKGYFRNVADHSADPTSFHRAFRGPGAFGETVAVLGAGAVGSRVIELLRLFGLSLIVYDPFLTPERTKALGVRIVSLEAAFKEGLVVTNHVINNEATAGMINRELLASMRDGATFINTGRGRTVVQSDLVDVLLSRHDLTALLDVTDPEPLPPDSPLLQLPNAIVSTHIAGSIGHEVFRQADYMIEEFDRFQRGEPLRYRVSTEDGAG